MDDNSTEGRIPGSFPHAPGLRLLSTCATGIAVWWCQLDRDDVEIEELSRLLSAAERSRADRFASDLLRRRYVSTRGTLRLLLAHFLRLAPADVPIEKGPRGRPTVASARAIDFNVAHTRDVAVIAIAHDLPHHARIGVDVEARDRRVADDQLAHKFLSPQEVSFRNGLPPQERRECFLRYWTFKEAMSKATGDGLVAPFRQLQVELGDGSPQLISGPCPYVPASWQLHGLCVPDGFLAALAVWTP